MKYHAIDMVGKFWIQRLPTLPPWTSEYVGRIVHVEDEDAIYYGATIAYGDWMNMSEHYIDMGTANDPLDAGTFTDRKYTMKIVNGNIRLYYD